MKQPKIARLLCLLLTVLMILSAGISTPAYAAKKADKTTAETEETKQDMLKRTSKGTKTRITMNAHELS